MRIITTSADLKCLVNDLAGPDATAADRSGILLAIAHMNHPRYGSDWTDFLGGLPENLCDLLDNVRLAAESRPGTQYRSQMYEHDDMD